MQNRPVLAYRTALHRFSLAGCPEKISIWIFREFIISFSAASCKGRYFYTQIFRCDIATAIRKEHDIWDS